MLENPACFQKTHTRYTVGNRKARTYYFLFKEEKAKKNGEENRSKTERALSNKSEPETFPDEHICSILFFFFGSVQPMLVYTFMILLQSPLWQSFSRKSVWKTIQKGVLTKERERGIENSWPYEYKPLILSPLDRKRLFGPIKDKKKRREPEKKKKTGKK